MMTTDEDVVVVNVVFGTNKENRRESMIFLLKNYRKITSDFLFKSFLFKQYFPPLGRKKEWQTFFYLLFKIKIFICFFDEIFRAFLFQFFIQNILAEPSNEWMHSDGRGKRERGKKERYKVNFKKEKILFGISNCLLLRTANNNKQKKKNHKRHTQKN